MKIASAMLRPAAFGAATAAILFVSPLSINPAAADTTLKFVTYVKNDKGIGDWFAAVNKEFENTHPGVKIEFTNVAPAAYAETMTTLFAGGSPPDIVHLAAFDYPKFAAAGWLEPLDPYIKRSNADMVGWAGQDKCKWKGQTFCILNLYFGFYMAYNEDLLAKAGVSVPKNYAEFVEAARKLTKDLNGDGVIDQFGTGHEIGAGVAWYVTEMLNYMLPAKAFWTNEKGQVTLDTPEMIEALTQWKSVIRANIMPRDPKPGDTRQLLIEGKIAMKIDGPWLYPIINQAKPEIRKNIKLTASPLSPPVGGTSNVLGIAKDISEGNKKLVWEYLQLAMSDKFQTLLGSLGQSLPSSPRADLNEARKINPDIDVLIGAQRAASKAGIDRIPPGLEVQYNEFSKMVMEETQRMIISDLDPKNVVKVMQKRAEEIQKSK